MMQNILSIWAVCLLLAALAPILGPTCPAEAGSGVLYETISVDPSDMAAQIEAALKDRPSDVRLVMALGEVYFMIGEADVSAEKPGDTGPRSMNQGFKKSESLFRDALRLDQKQYLAHYYLALIRMHTGRMDEAVDSLYKALEIRKDDYRIYQKLHSAYTTLGLHPQAIQVMSRAFTIFPGSFDTLRRLSISAMITGNAALALDYSSRALKIADDESLRMLRADAYISIEKPEGAKREAEAALKLNQSSARAHATLARALMMMGQQAGARQSAERALAIDPGNEAALQVLSDIRPTAPGK